MTSKELEEYLKEVFFGRELPKDRKVTLSGYCIEQGHIMINSDGIINLCSNSDCNFCTTLKAFLNK